jgi:hypothetical protein
LGFSTFLLDGCLAFSFEPFWGKNQKKPTVKTAGYIGRLVPKAGLEAAWHHEYQWFTG